MAEREHSFKTTVVDAIFNEYEFKEQLPVFLAEIDDSDSVEIVHQSKILHDEPVLPEMSMMKYFIKMWSMTCLMLMTILYINVYEQLGCNQPRSYKEALKSKNIVE